MYICMYVERKNTLSDWDYEDGEEQEAERMKERWAKENRRKRNEKK